MLKFGNHKLSNNVAIFNMSPADTCPSKILGLCLVSNNNIKCYAEKAEKIYPAVLPARKKQEIEWKEKTKEQLLEEFYNKIKKRKKETKYLRYNESGDFHNQEDITKLSYIADGLKTIDIITFGYSARSDLDFSKAKFLCKGSGFEANNGICRVFNKNEETPEGYIVCPADKCKTTCNLCKINYPYKIGFIKH